MTARFADGEYLTRHSWRGSDLATGFGARHLAATLLAAVEGCTFDAALALVWAAMHGDGRATLDVMLPPLVDLTPSPVVTPQTRRPPAGVAHARRWERAEARSGEARSKRPDARPSEDPRQGVGAIVAPSPGHRHR